MSKGRFFHIWALNILFAGLLYAQNDSLQPIEVVHADEMILHDRYPGLKLLTGHVKLRHKDALLTCKKALLDTKNNFAEAIENVELNQGDTLFVRTHVLRFDGDHDFALAMGDVFMQDPTMQLQTDTLYYDLKHKTAYYETGGQIRDTANYLESLTGKYYIKKSLYDFSGNVKLINPDYTIESEHLQYNTQTATAYFPGPTKISTGKDFIYAENGYYDTKQGQALFKNNAYIQSGKSWIAADSLIMDKTRNFYGAGGNVRMHDPDNRLLVTAGYAEQWKDKDSLYLTGHPVIINYDENRDSLYLTARDIYVRGPRKKREVFAYPSVYFYGKDFSGRADSLYRSEARNILSLFRHPVIWTEDSQITGKEIHIYYDSVSGQPDSLYIPADVFIIQKDSAGYNQIKGKSLTGKFLNGKLRKIFITGNTETIYYVRDENNELIGVDRSVCSRIEMELDENGKISYVKLLDHPQGTTYPPDSFPGQLAVLKGFDWRGNERIKSAKEIFQGETKEIRKPEMRTAEPVQPEKIRLPSKLFKGI
jgi:lipopolysaccharide export system protein LptA